MADDKSRIGGPDRRRVAGRQAYEVGYFASKHRISRAEAREIIQKAGSNRDRANQMAEQMKH